MPSAITLNPAVTTNAAGTFAVSSSGYIQGTTLQDPNVRNQLAGGILGPNETLPMWGGVAINDTTAPVGTATNLPEQSLGGYVTRATNINTTGAAGGVTGFSVFDQDHAMVLVPGAPIPLASPGMMVNFYRLGSNARVVVACDPALANSLLGNPTPQQVSWDFNAQMLIQYNAGYPANVITAASWSAGQTTWTTTTNHGVAVGEHFTISGMTPAGYNGDFVAVTGTATNSLVANVAANPGASTVQGTLVAGGGALPCRVINVNPSNSMVVVYNAVTGANSWNYTGCAAVILI